MTDKVYKSKNEETFFCNCSASLIWSMHCLEATPSAVSASPQLTCSSAASPPPAAGAAGCRL